MSILVIIFLIMFITAFQVSLGPIAFMHAQETCVDVAIGAANQCLFAFVVVTSFLASYIIDKIGSIGMFAFFLTFNIFAVGYIKLLVKDTLKDKDGKLLNDK